MMLSVIELSFVLLKQINDARSEDTASRTTFRRAAEFNPCTFHTMMFSEGGQVDP